MKTIIPLAVAAMILASCATDVANRYYSNEHYPSRPTEDVLILSEKPNKPYEVIADFQSRGDTSESLRKKAAKIGADAIIVTHLGGNYNSNDQWAGQDSQNRTYSRIVGTAIKFKQ